MLFLSTFVCSTFHRAFSVTPLEKWPVPSTSPGRGLEHVAIELFQTPWLCCSLSCLRQRPLFHGKDNPWANRRQFFFVNLEKVLDMSINLLHFHCLCRWMFVGWSFRFHPARSSNIYQTPAERSEATLWPLLQNNTTTVATTCGHVSPVLPGWRHPAHNCGVGFGVRIAPTTTSQISLWRLEWNPRGSLKNPAALPALKTTSLVIPSNCVRLFMIYPTWNFKWTMKPLSFLQLSFLQHTKTRNHEMFNRSCMHSWRCSSWSHHQVEHHVRSEVAAKIPPLWMNLKVSKLKVTLSTFWYTSWILILILHTINGELVGQGALQGENPMEGKII